MTKPCLYCNRPFLIRRQHAKFCTTSCRIKHWEREHPRVHISNKNVIFVDNEEDLKKLLK